MPIISGKYVNPGWHNGMAPAVAAQELQALCDALEAAPFPKITVTFADVGTSVTATNGIDTVTLAESSGTWSAYLTSYGTWTLNGTVGSFPYSTTVTVDTVKEYNIAFIPQEIEHASWFMIETIAQSGEAENYWSIGDTKSVLINGTIGNNFEAVDYTCYVYVIGINHQGVNGITFGGFKNAQTNGVDICLVDNLYGSPTYVWVKMFNVNHRGTNGDPYNTNYGGWKGCCLRYDILGSTDTPPSEYGSDPTAANVGYDATSTTATSPVSGTLMAALPSDLRSVMKPMTVFTDNTGGSSNAASNVTASVDYLPLLAEFEVFGVRSAANQFEQSHQAQYAYYANGNSTVKYQNANISRGAFWWARSPYYNNASDFCAVQISGSTGHYQSRYSYGLSPVFLV